MKTTVWVLQGLLAIAFLGAGATKLFTAREALVSNPQMGWAADFSATQIKLIGGAEVAGAEGLILPAALSIAPVLTPVAGAGLAVLMLGAVATHLSRGENPAAPAVLALLCIVVAVGRIVLRRKQNGSAQASLA